LSNGKSNTISIAAIVLCVLAVALLLWQFVFKKNANAVAVNDLPESAKLKPGTERSPGAGPIPVDISRRRGGAVPANGGGTTP